MEVKVVADAMCKLVEHIVIGLDETARPGPLNLNGICIEEAFLSLF